MFLSTYTQQPADVLDYDVPYDLVTGDTIIDSDAVVSPAGLVVTPGVVGSKVKLWVSGGTHGTTYKVTLTTTTSQGRVKQDELKFKIKDY